MTAAVLAFWRTKLSTVAHPRTVLIAVALGAVLLAAVGHLGAGAVPDAAATIVATTGGIAGLGLFAAGYGALLLATRTSARAATAWTWKSRTPIARRRLLAAWVALGWFALLVITQPGLSTLLGAVTVAFLLSIWVFASSTYTELGADDEQLEKLAGVMDRVRAGRHRDTDTSTSADTDPVPPGGPAPAGVDPATGMAAEWTDVTPFGSPDNMHVFEPPAGTDPGNDWPTWATPPRQP